MQCVLWIHGWKKKYQKRWFIHCLPLSKFNSSWPFVLCSAVIHGLAANDKRMYEIYDQFGPTPCICFDYVNDPHAQIHFEVDHDKALRNLSSETLHEMIEDSELFSMDSLTHTLLLMKLMKCRSKELRILDSRDDYATIVALIKPRVEFVSHVIKDEVWAQLWKQSPPEQLQLYH